MSVLNFTRDQVGAALSRGVRQCVVVGSRPLRETLHEILKDSPDPAFQVLSVDEDAPSDSLAVALEKSEFDKLKASVFVWLGGAGYRTAEAMLASLAFIASLPKGSAVIFDYAVERTSVGTRTQTALDALASRLSTAGGSVMYLIQPQAVAAMLRGLGFQQIVDLAQEEVLFNTARLVSAVV